MTATVLQTEIVRVPLNDRAYDIHIGENLIDRAGELLTPILKRSYVAVVTDENVDAAQGARLRASLENAGIDGKFIILPAGETTKSFANLEALTEKLLGLGIERDDVVIAFGGGVIGDLTGFASAVLRRGCRFVQIPTSLLAQVDSAVGGKTAINAAHGKNLIGAFHQPSMVITDICALDTLPQREVHAGYAEIVKYGLIADAPFFDWLEQNGTALLAGDNAARVRAVSVSCRAKAAIVSADEHERGKRALLNLGHTFGHAFEAAFGYGDRLLHGEGVALGMVLAFEYSVRLRMCAEADAARVKKHITACGLPATIADLNAAADVDLTGKALINYMMQDKKVEQGDMTLILARGIGNGEIVKKADTTDVTAFLNEKNDD